MVYAIPLFLCLYYYDIVNVLIDSLYHFEGALKLITSLSNSQLCCTASSL